MALVVVLDVAADIPGAPAGSRWNRVLEPSVGNVQKGREKAHAPELQGADLDALLTDDAYKHYYLLSLANSFIQRAA